MSESTGAMGLTLIGTGAVRVNSRRGGPATVVQVGGKTWLFDCGRNAVHQLDRFGFPVESIGTVFISHLHFDHVCDLAHLILLGWNNSRQQELQLIGPVGLADMLRHQVDEGYAHDIASRLAHGKSDAGLRRQVREFSRAGICLQTSDTQVSVLPTPHAGLVNLNYRIDRGNKRLVITSDTTPVPELIDFCRHADLLVCECSGTAEFLARQPWGSWHMNPDTVANLAQEAQVKRVIIKHLVIENFDPDPDVAEKMADRIRQGFDGDVRVGEDGMALSLVA
ncbi:MBL fold metallo-hydrolase [candidate division KSB1 bacterium]|nr:MBL fold metallo-hydrolase [candidate division KSB1 bacterium]